jgi:hypothetical protein
MPSSLEFAGSVEQPCASCSSSRAACSARFLIRRQTPECLIQETDRLQLGPQARFGVAAAL